MRREDWVNTPVDVRISFPTSNMHGLNAQITLSDHMSGKTIASIDLSGQQFTELLGARNVTVMGELLPSEHYEKVGKKYVTEVVQDFPEKFRAYRPGWNAERTNLNGATDEMKEWGKLYAAQHGWEGATWSHHNYGWSLRVYRYDDATVEQRQAVMERYLS